LGATDTGVKFNNAKFYRAATTPTYTFGTDDVVIEVVAYIHTVGVNAVVTQRPAAGAYWAMFTNGAPLYFVANDGAGHSQTLTISAGITAGWYHILVIRDISGSGIAYLNTTACTAVANSSVGACDAGYFEIGAEAQVGAYYSSCNVAYCAAWHAPAWLDTHLQATLAKQRFYAITGVKASRARGNPYPETCTRSTTAYLDKREKGPEAVAWSSIVGCTAVGSTLTKTGAPGWNAGAVSTKAIAGNGYIECTPDDATIFGLSNGNPGVTHSEIDFSIYVEAGTRTGYIMENGSIVAYPGAIAAGTRCRVAVETGAVKYYVDSVLKYTSLNAPTFPLLFDCSIYSTGKTISSVSIYGKDTLDQDIGTANAIRKAYLVGPNWPRVVSQVDKNGATIQGYLSEPQNANVVADSTTYAGWTTYSGTFAADTNYTSPLEGVTPYKHTEDNATAPHGLAIGANAGAASEKVCTSFYVKRLGANARNVFHQAGNAPATGGDSCLWDLDTGGVTLANGAIAGGVEDWGDGWKRCWYNWQYLAGGGHNAVLFLHNGVSTSYSGSGQAEMLICGYMEEHYLNSNPVYGRYYPSSYIPTISTTDVTRVVDRLLYDTTSNLDGQHGRVSFSVLQPNIEFTDSNAVYCSATDVNTGAAQEYIYFGYHSAGADAAVMYVGDGGVATGLAAGSIDLFDGAKHDLMFSWRAADIKQTVDGTMDGQDTTITGDGLPEALRYLCIGGLPHVTISYMPGCPVGPFTIYSAYK